MGQEVFVPVWNKTVNQCKIRHLTGSENLGCEQDQTQTRSGFILLIFNSEGDFLKTISMDSFLERPCWRIHGYQILI